MKKKDQRNLEVGLGVAALAAAAGAAYLYGTKDGDKKRKQIRGWALKAKGEVLEKIETMKEASEDAYNKAVDEVMDKYKKVKKIDPLELKDLINELKSHWKNIKKGLGKKSPGDKKANKTLVAKKSPTKRSK